MKNKIITLTIGLFISLSTAQAQNWTEAQKTLPVPYLNNTNEEFGKSIAVDGDYVIVGAPGYSGKKGCVYLLYNNGTSWTAIAKLTASDGTADDNFGISVGISGNVVIVGTYQDDDKGSNSGSAYIFEKPLSGWIDMTETAKLTASDGAPDDNFGFSVCISNNVAVIGAYRDDDNESNSGSAYVFERHSTGWANMTESAKLTASDPVSEAKFGCSVGISGNYIAIGAHQDNENGNGSGSAYIFRKTGTVWESTTELAKLTASDGSFGDHLGSSIHIDENIVVVGAPGSQNEYGASCGASYIFKKPYPDWNTMTETAKLTASDGALGDDFGCAVDISDNTIIIGASDDYNNGSSGGSAYIFKKPYYGWETMTETAKLNPADATEYDFSGYAVAIFGENAFVGTYGNDGNGNKSGASYIFKKPTNGWVSSSETQKILPTLYLNNNQEEYGNSVSIDGNYAVVGMPYYKSSGCAYILYNNENEWETIATLTTTDASSLFGYSVDISGDVIIVGAYGDGHSGSYSGSAYIFEKPVNGWSDMTETAKLTASDATIWDEFGKAVNIFNNVIIVGAPKNQDNGYATGSAYIFTKPTNGWENMTETKKLLASDASSSSYFGNSVSISDDKVIVGAKQDENSGFGSAYIFEKNTSNWTSLTETAKLSNWGSIRFGNSVSISGDYIVIGAYQDNDYGYFKGAAYIYKKPETGWQSMDATAELTASDATTYGFWGSSVSISGDNVVVSAYMDDNNGLNSGSAYIFRKPTTGWADMTETIKLIATDADADDNFGYSIGISGDNIIIGAPKNDDNGYNSGSAYIYEYTTNTPPIISNPIQDQTETEGFATTTIDLAGVFSDVDSDALSLSVVSSNTNIATASISGNTLTITEVALGTTNITVTATDGNGGTIDDVFSFTINQAPNTAPTVVNPIVDQAQTEGFGSTNIDLTDVFSDVDGDVLSLSVVSSNTNVATTSISGNTLTITEVAFGSTNITVTATDGNGGTVDDVFSFTINQTSNAAPTVLNPIADQAQTEGFVSTNIDLTDVFSDADGDALSLSVVSSNTNVATASTNGNTLTISEVGLGSTNITLTANDGNGGTVDDMFSFTIISNGNIDFLCTASINYGELLTVSSWQTVTVNSGSGAYWELNADEGVTYSLSTCNDNQWDTYLRIYDITGNVITENDDNGEHCQTPSASADWLCGASGKYYVLLTDFQCEPLSNNVELLFKNNTNIAPTVANPISDQTQTEGFVSTNIDLVNVFSDADGDALSLSVATSNTNVATVSISGNTLTIIEVGLGSTNITLTANDGNSGTVDDVFSFTINQMSNTAPTVANPISDQTQTEGFGSINIDLTNAFSDADGDALSLSVVSFNTNIATASISDKTLAITEIGLGSTNITLTANDGNGGTVDDVFSITINATTTSIEKLAEFGIKVYPNPSSGIFNIEHNNANQNLSLKIFNIAGKTVFQNNLEGSKTFIDLNKNGKGVYIMIFEISDKTIKSKVIIK